MFSTNNKYINKFYSIISNNIQSNNVQTTNCVATNVYTDHIYELRRLGLNNNNPAYTLDVNGNINFTGKLYNNSLPYTVGSGYWNLVGDSIINANNGAVIIDTWLDMTNNSYINFDLNSFGFKIQNGTSNPYTISLDEFATLRGIQTDTTIQDQLTYLNAISANISSNTSIGGNLSVTGNTILSGYVGINSNPFNTYNLNVGGTENITGLLTVDSIILTSSDPVYSSNSVVPKSYVDTLASGIVLLAPSTCATTESTDTSTWVYNGTDEFSNVSNLLIIDGYSVQNSNRVLVKDQTNEVQNGIYDYNQSLGTLTRAQDLAYGSDASNVVTFIKNGSTNKNTSFLQTNYGAIVGQDNLIFHPFHTINFNINNTLQFTGNTLGVNPNLTLTTLETTGNTHVDGDLLVSGSTTLINLVTADNGLNVINGTQTDSLDVTGSTTLTGLLTANGSINTTSITTSANESVGGNLSVGGTTTLTGLLTANGSISTPSIITTSDSTFNGVRVGKGAGNVSTNTVVGLSALPVNTTGYDNTSTGYQSLQSNTTGHDNTAIGINALQSNTTGNTNTAVGAGAIEFGTTGTANTVVGYDALWQNNGSNNSCLGFQTLYHNLTGTNNSAFGYYSLFNSTGTTNTAIGFSSGQNLVSGNFNTFLGANTDITNSATTYTQSTAIGYNAKITASNQIVLGTSTETVIVPGTATFAGPVTSTNGFVSGSDYRIKENITPLDSSFTVDDLKPIRFINKNTGKADYGLIAHELQSVYPELVTGEKDGEQLQSVNYQGLIGILIQEVKNLKKEVNELKEKVNN